MTAMESEAKCCFFSAPPPHQASNGKVGMYLGESLMIRWEGWDVLEGRFNERMERLGHT